MGGWDYKQQGPKDPLDAASLLGKSFDWHSEAHGIGAPIYGCEMAVYMVPFACRWRLQRV